MKIAVDVMGGDNAPLPNIDGAIEALSSNIIAGKENIEIVLVGEKKMIQCEIDKKAAKSLPIEIQDATQVIEMDESPIEACRKKQDSSIMVGLTLLKEGEVDGFVSAGNSGAVMAGAIMNLERLKGVIRPAIAAVFPTLKDNCIIIDVGANAECKSKHLYQFAAMGEAYVKYIYKRRIPRVALLSMGHEEGKGNNLTQLTYRMLMKSKLNFIGNIEGSDIMKGVADVIVCDGFVGNIALKFFESVTTSIMGLLKNEIDKNIIRKIGASIMKGAFQDIKKKISHEEVGGAPLLGVKGSCIICHGISTAKTIHNAIKMSAEFVEQDVNKHIQESFE